VPAPPDLSGGTPGPVRKKSNSGSSAAEPVTTTPQVNILLLLQLFISPKGGPTFLGFFLYGYYIQNVTFFFM